MKTLWLTVFTTVLSVVLTVALQDRIEVLPINGIVYQLLSSPNKYSIFIFLILLGLSPMLFLIIDRYLVRSSKEIVRSIYLIQNGTIISSTIKILSFAFVCFSFGCVVQASLGHGWVIVRDHKYADQLQRQRLIERGNEQVRLGNLAKAKEYYESILQNDIDPSDFNYDLRRHITEIEFAEIYWNERASVTRVQLSQGNLFRAGHEFFKAQSVLNNIDANRDLENRIINLGNQRLEEIQTFIENCRSGSFSQISEVGDNLSLFSSLSKIELDSLISNGNIDSPPIVALISEICERVESYETAQEYIDALSNGELYSLIAQKENELEEWYE